MKYVVSLKIAALSDQEIRSMLDNAQLEKARKEEEKPQIQVFGIGAEGPSQPQDSTSGDPLLLFWSAPAIESLHKAVRMGTPIYFGHDSGPREVLGWVVGKSIRVIEGRLQVLAAVFIKPDKRKEKYDIASIEAFVESVADPQTGMLYVSAVESVSGIAVGNSAVWKPGFDSATLKASIAAFNKANKTTSHRRIAAMDLNDLTPGLVKRYIREQGISIADLFTRKEIEGDPLVLDIVSSGAEKLAKELDSAKKRFEAEKTVLSGKIKTLSKEASHSKAAKILPQIAEKRNLSERQKKFIESELEDFSAEDSDNLDVAVSQFIEKSLEKYTKISKSLGLSEEDDKAGETKKQGEDSGKKVATPPATPDTGDDFLLS